ncbi:MAG: carboxypeptidase-like regulatory domain-containing protein [Pyrinomonadaceae bacterium]
MRQILIPALFLTVLAACLFSGRDITHSSGISSTDGRSLFVCGAVPIGFGDFLNGILESGDCVDPNTALYDGYTFIGVAGQQIEIVMASAAYVPGLRLVQGNYPGGAVVATGVDPGNGSRRITAFSIPANGDYTIVASSSTAGGVGDYTLRFEPTIPQVDLIQRTSPNPTTPGSTVGYSVFFNTAVTGVDAADFALTTSGISGASILNVSGSGTIYTVSINTGAGIGNLRLDVIDNDTIVNGLGARLGGTGAGNGSFNTGPTYTIAASTPTPSPTPPPNTILVTNTNDSGAGSLRQAIDDVVSGGNVGFSPLFASPQTIVLESELRVAKNLTITGPGPNLLTVSGNNAVRVFNVGGSLPGVTVTISGIKISGGRAPNNDFGGGIEKNFGSLTISNCVISGNTVPGTSSFGGGGGIDNFQGPLTITGSVITGNSANGYGGGVLSDGGVLTITDSTISGNSTRIGGGVFFLNAAANISRSTISGNTAVSQGGGAIVQDGSLAISNSTVSGNTANNASAAGAALFVNSVDANASLQVTGCTIANNTAPANSGGGMLVSAGTTSAAATVRSSIVANNTEPNLRTQNAAASIASQGFNLTTGSGNGFLTQPSDKLNAQAGLAPLASNGGPTQTHALLPASQAIDAGMSFASATDQRGSGFLRIVDLSPANASGGDGADIGAFELQSEPPPATVSIGGRVTTPSGLGVRNAVVALTDPKGIRRTATTSSFGIYSFTGVQTGVLFVVGVSSKRYRFAPQSITPTANLSNIDFVGLE